ncbi:YARHG domain-containing protein [Flavisolibacter tropicus]|uniref:YARHG domain-containing protein n=1 Tax=Flavisolibacter tropicus TaxID=1492898 RepID=UPI00082E63F2|nr:YARHG domain-containing protein [Flavisolibacter tropicus]
MRLTALFLALVVLASCTNSNSASADLKSKKKNVPKEVVVPVVKYGIEGYYTGVLSAKEYKESVEGIDKQITICIDSLNGYNVYGYSVVAGNKRPFKGTYEERDDQFVITAKEPGSDKTDGRFSFSVHPKKKVLEGSWKANNATLNVTESEFKLEQRPFKYSQHLEIPESMAGVPLPGSYNEETEESEALTADIVMINASQALLKAKDVENMYKADLEVVRNAIYARHGYSFKNARMRVLFDNNVSWYMPLFTDVTPYLTEVEKKNIALIKRYEAHAAKYYDAFGR